MTSCGTFQKLRPLSLLTHLSNSYDSAHLKVLSNSVAWSIYLDKGKIIYASHSVEPFDRLDCHLRRLAHKIPSLSSDTRTKLRLMFENESRGEQLNINDYQAICWLIEHQHLTNVQAKNLIEGLVKEVIESFLLVEEGSYELHSFSETNSGFCQLDLPSLVKYAEKQLQAWQALAPEIVSPYQCPYLASSPINQKLSSELRQKLTAILKGFSFHHLAILLNQDELRLAQSLYPYIKAGNILLQPPSAPFDRLPFIQSPKTPVNNYSLALKIPTSKITVASSLPPTSTAQLPQIPSRPPQSVNVVSEPINNLPEAPTNKKTYKIVCVDDSPAMLKEISYFLDDESFAVSTINDPVKALMQIVRLKPDLILLDVKMAGIDGYELCRLLRNHSFFKTTPIIMVTGNTGIIDRVKARIVGASGYLTKPFAQSDLLKIVFRHLSE
ncbi:response regulator [Synechocystis sp. PCC 7509]|uniref:response regulator n=1 Tax=Synechocystis sp. PCC 7509 TaxID=927677 RepID=UPI0002ACDA89|nr:response regulator [Synechocystis sp. PCC 7509]